MAGRGDKPFKIRSSGVDPVFVRHRHVLEIGHASNTLQCLHVVASAHALEIALVEILGRLEEGQVELLYAALVDRLTRSLDFSDGVSVGIRDHAMGAPEGLLDVQFARRANIGPDNANAMETVASSVLVKHEVFVGHGQLPLFH